MNKEVIKSLTKIPGVGPKIAEDLIQLKIRSVSDLAGKDPEILYQQICLEKGQRLDRCVLYVFRCAVYYASHTVHDPHLLKWWNWKEHH